MTLPPGFTHLELSRLVRNAATRVPDKDALVCGKRKLSYRQLIARSNRVANAVRGSLQIEPGQRVALVTANRLEYFELVLGLADIGAVAVTVNPGSSVAELNGILADCSARLVVIDPALKTLCEAVAAAGLPCITFGSEYEDWISQSSAVQVATPVPEWASFCICYTSGTTGRPKGVQLPHRSRVLTVLAMGVEYACFGMNDRFLAVAPLFHGAGFAFALAAISFGGTCFLQESFDAAALPEQLLAADITGVFMVPTHFSRLFALPGAQLDRLSASHRLRTVISNAAALPAAMKEASISCFGEGILHETYGSTEAGVVTNMRPDHILRYPGSVGTPFIATEVEVRGEGGELCIPGEIGELFSRSPYSFIGYLNRPEDTANTLHDNWVTVGDLASRDENGYLTILGRKKDMVISGGVNIYPGEIETVISRIPGVIESAVVGLPSPEWGEALHAFVVLDDAANVSEANVVAACRQELSSYKVPKAVTLLSELPKNPSGKVLKNQLRERYAQG